MPKEASSRRRMRASVVAALVLALSGLLFTISAQVARNSGTDRHPEDVVQLVRQRSERVAALTDEVSVLDSQVAELLDEEAESTPRSSNRRRGDRRLTGSREVGGPAVKVTLTDAQTDIIPEGAVADDLVVHQQDIQAVMNAMWRSGAEAMTIQGRRVTPQTAVRCVGNVLYLHGEVYSPPYEVAAIGDPDALVSSLENDSEIAVYREYVAAYGLGWDVQTMEHLTMPAADGSGRLNFASPLISDQQDQ